ncbi:GGDEF domain-containing protein [Nakamurella endophytica]|uniref:GGDEF domain-containing protein n=1 Tax=Nakamurella endophytica TaxID=1748367 RepID=A0A917WE60_9ACTN|nr:GGDEF domain-containing protein [Nakamurella endophytica]GGL94396.1 hypothetical protein GCM10011594_12750 [Nakamurella endophytica]
MVAERRQIPWLGLFERSPDISAVLAVDGTLLAVNEAWSRFGAEMGADASCGVGGNYLTTCRRSADGGDAVAAEVLAGFERVLAGTSTDFVLHYPFATADEEFWYRLDIRGVTAAAGGEPVLLVRHLDVTDFVRTHQDLRTAAGTDPLTGLANRRSFDQSIAALLAGDVGARPILLLLGDLDHFKQINDRHGHLTGDACLVRVAQWLRENTRTDDLVSRWGGDEFAVVVSSSSATGVAAVAARLRRGRVDGPDGIPLTVTWGAAIATAGDTASSLIDRADTALRATKAARPATVALRS